MMRSQSLFGVVHRMRYFYDKPNKIIWRVLSDSESMNHPKRIPLELQYAIAVHPSRLKIIKSLIDQGHGLALGKYPKAGNGILKAVKIITATHRGALYPWLEDLVVKNISPVFSASDLEEASLQGIDLMEQAALIKNHASQLIQVKIVESGARAVSLDDKKMVASMARDIQKIHSLQAVEYFYRQAVHQKKHIYTLLIVGLLFFAPLIHGLEFVFAGLGLFISLILPNIFMQAMLAITAYNYGAATWQIKSQIKKLWPEIAFLFFGSVLVTYFFISGALFLAGMVFSLSATAFAVGRGLRTILGGKKIFTDLVSEGKIAKNSSAHGTKIVYGPYWIVYLLSLLSSTTVTIAIFLYFSQYLTNGWLLFVLAVLYYPLSDLLFLLWSKTTALRFKIRLHSLLRSVIIS